VSQVGDGPVEVTAELHLGCGRIHRRPDLGEGLLDEVLRCVDIVNQDEGILPSGASEAPYQRFEPGSVVRLQPSPPCSGPFRLPA